MAAGLHTILKRKLFPVLWLCAAVSLLCSCRAGPAAPIPGEDTAQREAYLQSLGWQVRPGEVETLDLKLPEPLGDSWEAYAQVQAGQGLPLGDFAGQAVRRCTYAVTNYPGREDVQINLFLCRGQIIGGDLIALGQDGFQTGLRFPQ